MTQRVINNITDLYNMLDAAIQLEHATIPPYLTALYSLYSESNIEANQVIRAVLIEEMLHLTLSANVLNAVGRHPNLLAPNFVPLYPTYLPDGETDFQVSIAKFSPATLDTFLAIERPSKKSEVQPTTSFKGCISRKHTGHFTLQAAKPLNKDSTVGFYSIGDFYQAILDGIEYLESEAQVKGETIFIGDPKFQVSNAYYYSGGGTVIEVTDLATARSALKLIVEQGEGHGENVFDSEGEISHYYRFEQLKLGQFYMLGDEPGAPSGETFSVDYDKVYPLKENAKLADYPEQSLLFNAAKQFNQNYQGFLSLVNRAFQGEQHLLLGAVCDMFRLKEHATQLIRNPIEGEGEGAGQLNCNGSPTFEMNYTQAAPMVTATTAEAV